MFIVPEIFCQYLKSTCIDLFDVYRLVRSCEPQNFVYIYTIRMCKLLKSVYQDSLHTWGALYIVMFLADYWYLLFSESPEPVIVNDSSHGLATQVVGSGMSGLAKQLLVIRGSNQPPTGPSSGVTVQRVPLTVEQTAAVQKSGAGPLAVSEVKYMLQGKVLGRSPASGSGSMVSIVNGKVSRPVSTGRLQIVRVHPSEAASLRSGQGVKRCLELELPTDNSQCYFGAKRQRTQEVITSQPSQPRPSTRALNFDDPKSSPVTPLSFPSPLPSPVMVTSSSFMSHSDLHTPTLQLNCTSSPVMLLSSTVATRPTTVQAGHTLQVLKSATGIQEPYRTVVSPLVTSAPQPSPVGTVRTVTSKGTPSNLTPLCVPGVSLRPLRSIQPTNAILNLGPHLMADSETDVKGMAPRILQVPLSTLTAQRSKQPQCFTFDASSLARLSAQQPSNNGDVVLTPRDRIITSDMIAAGITPGSGTRLTPNSFFRSTPGGLPDVSITQSLRTEGSTSAFKVVSAQTGREITLTADNINAARKLQLTKLSPCL